MLPLFPNRRIDYEVLLDEDDEYDSDEAEFEDEDKQLLHGLGEDQRRPQGIEENQLLVHGEPSDFDKEKVASDHSKKQERKRRTQVYGKAAAMQVMGMVLPAGISHALTAARHALAYRETNSVLGRLEALRRGRRGLEKQLLDYIIRQKKRARLKHGLSAGGAGRAVAAYGVARAGVKMALGTKGKLRKAVAVHLHQGLRDEDEFCWTVVQYLNGNKNDGLSEICSDDDGWMQIAALILST